MTMMLEKVGKDGHIFLGKKYAGREVVIDQIRDGVWFVKAGKFIPDDEQWLHQPDVSATLDAAIEWAEQNPPSETDLDKLAEKLNL
ncbi:MAG: hypothetical protein V2I97_03830 [Desulfococcaceae bacterium]|jgi:hypothetical protein|nr:hypothetical protein [Desulfococcaceae bacterium]